MSARDEVSRLISIMRRRSAYLSVLIASVALFAAAPVRGFILNPNDPDPWLSTASGPRTGNGHSATITWSIVPDGTNVTRDTGIGTAPSNLIAFMNTNFGGNPAQPDLTLQPWFHLFDESFGRWAELGGVTYVYESNDDGVLHPSASGALGVRGDIRIGGYNIDGAGDVLAFNYLPPNGSDMVLDTGEAAFFANAANNHVNFRNTVMHEIGHGFGMLHVNSTSNLLMEPVINSSFDGPQLDEVRGVQFFFGDANEESSGGQGNGSAALATSLGTIADGATATVGAAANVLGQVISATATDFVSISNLGDADYYSFTVSQPSLLSAALTPRGGVFTQASQGQTPTSFDANARNDLALTVFATNGMSILATASANPAGAIESLADVTLAVAGTYYARITGADDTIQLYELSLSAAALLPGDYNVDDLVDAADYVIWRKSDGTPAGYNTWRANFGETSGSGSVASENATVPEPATLVMLILAATGWWFRRGQAA
jgi:serralysin